jgi:hypothetical protein
MSPGLIAKSAPLFLALAIGCGSAPDAASPKAPSFSGDYVVTPSSVRREALGSAPRATGAIVYVDFMGDLVQQGSPDAVDPDQSEIAPQQLQVPPFNSAIPAPRVSSADAQLAIVDRLRTFYLPYDVTFTTTRPASPPYTMVLVGGSNNLFSNGAAAGIAPLDCDNTNPSNLVFVFSVVLSPDYGGVVSIAITAAHESGHSFGLEHTGDPNDIMYSVAMPTQTLQQLFHLGFGQTGSFSGFNAGETQQSMEICGRGDPVNAGVLAATLGARASVPAPPTLSWDFPPAGDYHLPLTIPLAFSASPDTVRIEVYKNLELVASLKSPPYQTTLTAADGESFYLTAEAITAEAARTSLTRTSIAGSKYPTPCTGGSMCASGLTCKDGYCRAPLGTTCTSSLDCASELCQAVGGQAGTTCTARCDDASPCPDGAQCESGLCGAAMMLPATDGGACDGACPDGGVSAPSGGCAISGHAPAGGFAIALLLLAALALRRRPI